MAVTRTFSIIKPDATRRNLTGAVTKMLEDAVKKNRDVMGATNPADATEGTIRKAFAESIEANSVHGSDSEENAKIEIAHFFKDEEIVG